MKNLVKVNGDREKESEKTVEIKFPQIFKQVNT